MGATDTPALLDDPEGWEPWDEDNPRSLINIAPREIKDTMRRIPKEWLLMGEKELESFLEPTTDDSRLRKAFWAEYEHAQALIERMNLARISQRVGVVEKFLLRQLKSTERLAWILCPPVVYEMYLDEALDFSFRRLRDEILTIPFRHPDGTPDHKAMELFIKATAFIDMRKNGGFVNKNLHVHTTSKDMRNITQQLSLKEIDERIKELESQTLPELPNVTEAKIPEVVE